MHEIEIQGAGRVLIPDTWTDEQIKTYILELNIPAPSKKLPASAYRTENVPPATKMEPWKYAGSIEIDWSDDKTMPYVRGDIAEIACHFPRDLTLRRRNDFWACFAEDAERIKAVCIEKNFRVVEIFPKSSPTPSSTPDKRTGATPAEAKKNTTAPAGRSGANQTPAAPTVVSGTIERCNAGMAGKAPVRQITLLLANKTKPTYSCFDKKWFEALDAGLGKQAELVTKQNGKYTNVIGARKIGSKEWDEDGTPVIQRRDQEAGGQNALPMKFSVDLEKWRIHQGEWASAIGDPFGAFIIPGPCGRDLRVIASSGDASLGIEWEHVSVSLPNRCPNWPEMCRIKSLFWDDEETVMQLHPPKSQWINNHSFCLHMWRPLKQEIPLPPSETVGDKNLGTLK